MSRPTSRPLALNRDVFRPLRYGIEAIDPKRWPGGKRSGKSFTMTTNTSSKTVTLYTTSVCPYCTRAGRLLQDRGIAFEEVDLGSNPELRASLTEKTGMRTVPMIFIGEKCIGGYTELAALDESGELQRRLEA